MLSLTKQEAKLSLG